jgi:hypothetical protein
VNAQARHTRQTRQLLTLHALREERARAAQARARAERDAAQAAVGQREAEVARHRQARAALLARVHDEAAELARWAPYAIASQEDLDDRLERAEYALIDDEEALDEAQQRLDAHSAHWHAAHARHDVAADLVRLARRAQGAADEYRAERELDAAPRRAAASTRGEKGEHR